VPIYATQFVCDERKNMVIASRPYVHSIIVWTLALSTGINIINPAEAAVLFSDYSGLQQQQQLRCFCGMHDIRAK
jgi:hypothetical protein